MSLSHTSGWAALLQIQVEGVNTTRTVFSVGENVTLTCTLTSAVHVWTVPRYVNNAVFASVPPHSIGPFLLENEEVFPMDIRSSLSFTVFSDLGGVPITCSDGTGAQEPQTLTATVLGEAMWLCDSVSCCNKT